MKQRSSTSEGLEKKLKSEFELFFTRYGWSRQLLAAAHPGYGTFHPRLHKKIYHMYYQWVFLFFCIQVKLILSQEPIFPKTF